MTISFTKAHGAGNDFLLTWADGLQVADYATAARSLCDRHRGVGADGWIIVNGYSIRLFNSDGGEAELSGNGTRCAAALMIDAGKAGGDLTILTGAGPKRLRLLEREGQRFLFEMDMGRPRYHEDQLRFPLPLAHGVIEAAILDVGNPQCAILVDEFPAEWQKLGAGIEQHSMFPNRTNVSFVKPVDQHTIEVLFYERGAGPTLSSGTGSAGAAAAAILRGVAQSPVRVITGAGDLHLRWDDSIYLTGPAEIVAAGEFYSSGLVSSPICDKR